MKNSGYSLEDVEEAIKMFGLEPILKDAISLGKAEKMGEKALKYAIVGDKFRELFFKTYPGLLERIEREKKFGIKHSYVRAWSGPVRHLPEMKYFKISPRNTLLGADSMLYSQMFAHLNNEAVNTTIQTAEVYWAMANATAFNKFMEKWELKSRIFNYTHDSFEIYVYKPEREIVYALLNELVQINRQPFYGIFMEMSVEEADLTKEGEYLKHGRELNINNFKLPEKLKKDFDDNEGFIPIHGIVE